MRTQLCSFPFFMRIHSIFKEVIVFWLKNFYSAKYHAHSSECEEKIRKCQTRMVGILGGQLQQCVIVWQVRSVLEGVSEKCWSVWELVSKCWAWAIKWVWGQVKVKRGETAEKKHAHKAHCLHFRGQHSQIKTCQFGQLKPDGNLNWECEYLDNFRSKPSS